MHRVLASLVALLLLGASVATPDARADGPLELTSDNVEFIDNIPLEATATGAQLIKGFLYISSSRGLHIFDVHDPASPVLVGEYTRIHDPYWPQEEPATNGEILLLMVNEYAFTGPTIEVIDVRDKANPHVIGELTGAPYDLTMTCVLDCKWAYGSRGSILDLRDPSQPRLAGTWPHQDMGGAGHSIVEVAPGRVLVEAGSGPRLLDARRSPTSPEVVADSNLPGQPSGQHSLDWLGGMHSPHLLAGRGSFTSCALVSFDVSQWLSKGRVVQKDTYEARGQDTVPDSTPASFDCPHWFDAEPGYRDGGVVVAPWHARGVRFVKVTPKGELERAGYFYAPNGRSWTTLWGDGGYVFSIDYHRGLDILRFHGV